MATVYFGLAGEGRGHAARAVTLISHLRRGHRVVVLTFGQALEMLQPLYAGSDVEVRKIDGVHLEYGALGRMSPTKTVLRGVVYMLGLDRRARLLGAQLVSEGASLVISDFEPLSLRAAKHAKVPALSLDHPRFLQACRFDELPWHGRLKVWLMAVVIGALYGKPEHMVVSGFHLTPLRREYEHALTTGVLIRPELQALKPTQGPHLVAYFRRKVSKRVLAALQRCDRPILVFGLGVQPARGRVEFRPIQEGPFLEALSSCQAVITTCGNQLIGEAFYLNKPVLAFPELGNFEQQMNAFLLNRSGGGLAVSHRAFDVERIQKFLSRLDVYRSKLRVHQRSGNRQVEAYVDALLGNGRKPNAVSKGYSIRARATLARS